ncbi:ABC transporter ATP-binding protein [Bacillus pseudomycoides]|uniref:ABC transporter ATP-binding protein n=1 Tax=Bacillus pseudomycoides TaxID=64104 RepID=UPI000BF0C5AA|nr:ABC transporter ATP-binding protein [Bacillus pseudomycoides]PEI39896.1 bacitracin ABC transporter ATP-binding protein [Bacillus pseudomycoides]PGA66993.1 bacitracin ABC transporter ATP-binding protein [Bacillus pseudomycoides]PGE89334.1 bacitracin ABC transporter ATP-binding protein [Bacillus pseudomycoides]PHB10750.1 bacitracin ABC transporter ATP-binding protein [Bacillus pseudomycoides]PHE22816.1 bacitracin ABC transporter ATP-binding protein [Bacillus pseudomycoides]
MDILQVRDLSKIYTGKVSYKALSNIDLTINKGEFVGIMGPSGSGKTTFLNMISTIDAPTSGEVLINGKNPYRLSSHDLALFRRRELGFIFQSFNLLNTLTVKENILLPLTLDNVNLKEMNKRVELISNQLGIGEILNKRTYEISGGQAQRTAIARALIHSPQLVLADEPTGNLDSKAAGDVMELLTKLNKEQQATMMLVTHDPMAASYCDRVVFIKDGTFYNEICCSDNRSMFYQNIIDVLSLLGGNQHEFSSIRM